MQKETPPSGATALGGVELQTKYPDPSVCSVICSRVQFPPGLVGDIAYFIYLASPRPVYEISLFAAVMLLAGICGRSFNISGAGLNQYGILVAKTGRGKEAIANGIGKLMKHIVAIVPAAADFIGPTEIASPQALIKWLSRAPCIYSIVGEFGIKLREMSSPKAPPNISGLNRTLLDLYHKAGTGKVLGAMAYSKREDNSPVIDSPSFTLIGETTPEALFETFNESIVTSGMLSRISVVEYRGARVALSKFHSQALPSSELISKLASLCAQCASISSAGKVQIVGVSDGADAIFDRFNEFCDRQINSDQNSAATCELWNRAHLKALKIAAIHAVGVDHLFPCIDPQQAQSATDEVWEQTKSLIARFASGDIGAVEDNETLRRKAVIKAVMHYAETAFASLPKYGTREDMHRARIIPQSYLQRCLGDTAAFRKANGGATRALAVTLKNMLEADELSEMPKSQMVERFGVHPRSFAIRKAEAFIYPNEN